VATVHTEGINFGGLQLTLTWTNADGTRGSAAAITDALGVALFTAPLAVGNTEYIVRSGEVLESNAIEITGTIGGL
jgi:hypothetical protein